MKNNKKNGAVAEAPLMSQKELIARLNQSNKKLLLLNKEFTAIENKRFK